MAPVRDKRILNLASLEERTGVFADRAEAGALLAEQMRELDREQPLVLAIPCGGVPVALEIAARRGWPLDVAPVSKALFPWTSEAGFGAVAFDGGEWIDEEAVRRHALSPDMISTAMAQARGKVRRRLRTLRANRSWPTLRNRSIVLVDDGIAAGSTLRAAIAALRRQETGKIYIAVPTGSRETLDALAPLVDGIYCLNVRSGPHFTVAAAYASWSDVSEKDAERALHTIHRHAPHP